MAEAAAVLVGGGGQAGLVASWYLTQHGVEHLVLDAERRMGTPGGDAGTPCSCSRAVELA